MKPADKVIRALREMTVEDMDELAGAVDLTLAQVFDLCVFGNS